MLDKLFGKQDWSLLNLVLAIVALVSAWPAITLLIDLITGKPLSFESYAVVPPPTVDDPNLGQGVWGVYTGQATFTVNDPSAGQWLAALLIPIITAVVAGVCLLMVRKLVRNSRSGNAFDASSLLAVRILGLVLFSYGLFRPLIELLMIALITIEMRDGELNFAFVWHADAWWPILVGLVVGVVGEAVFGRGRELADDAEGLV